ncbi:bifunctional cobalt-precorrin-7 (C(5))-methyltransferase/cobalt-precorrin-6B (C(15))-methyltransferase [Thioflavicoccus mobilis]|nr:bifunctional cobalt-precorrin-7 (C(5))-methyltransferase/cobalt-precorrin-6B (C(15))-methyltransferase [Thioflavicoccus mobilis]
MKDPQSGRVAPWLSIIGVGEDGVEGLGDAARELISAAELVVAGRRHLELAAPLIRGETRVWASPLAATLPELLARRGRPVAVLASGDPFHFGVGATLARHVAPAEMRVLPQPSSLSLAAARLGVALQDCAVVSLCGRPLATLRPALQPGARVLVLSADGETPRAVCAALADWGLGASRVTVLEALGGPRERRRTCAAETYDLADVDPLNLLAIEVAAGPGVRVLPHAPGLPDDWFEHDGQITKREVRALTLSSLRPMAGELLWDIGCGSGSVAIEWLLAHPGTRAIALDADVERATRAGRNAERLGVPHLEVRVGRAPEALAGLPAPAAIFIGGGARDRILIDACWAALPRGGRLVVNAVALETQQALVSVWQDHGGELCRLSLERPGPLGGLHALRPALPIIHWAGVKA